MRTQVPPFWRYYGGKWRAAPRYPEPECNTIVEPFFGAGGFSSRYANRKVIGIDISPVICGIWRYLIATPAAEILSLPDIPEGGTVDDMGVCQEARWLAGFWCNNGAAQPRKTPTRWTDCEVDGTVKWGWGQRARQRIAGHVDQIRHWQVIEGDYREAPDIEATWFVDPTYQTPAGSHYPHTVDDHHALGRWVLERKGQIVPCDQEGADWLPWTGALDLKSTKGRGRTGVSREVFYHRSTRFQLTLLKAR